MTNAISATPTADQPPTITDNRSAAAGYADRWDWLRAAAFFCGAVFLFGLIPTALIAWYNETAPIQRNLNSYQFAQIILITDLALPATLLIAGSVLSDRTFWGADGRERLRAIGRLALALGVIAVVTVLTVTFHFRIYEALAPSLFKVFGFDWGLLLIGIEDGLVLGVALAFVFRRLSQRTGRAWLAGLGNATLLAGGILGVYSNLRAISWAALVWIRHAVDPLHSPGCAGGADAGCFPAVAQTWLAMGIVPIVVALLLGALIGAPLAYPHGAREARAPAAAGRAQSEGRFWWALGIAAGSLAAGLVVAGTRVYAAFRLYGTPFLQRDALYGTLIAVQLAPFGILALLCAIRLIRLPRDQRPAAWGVGALALISVLGLLPTLIPRAFLLPPMGNPVPSGRLSLGDSTFAFAASLGALLALCWWPATAPSIRRVLTIALAGWLGVVLAWVGYATYLLAVHNPSQFFDLVDTGVTFVILCLPLMLVGVWLGSWLLERRGLRRAGD